MTRRHFEDASGIYPLDSITSITPMPIKGDRADQSKITAHHTCLTTIGGHTHNTSIPYDVAKSAVKAEWGDAVSLDPPPK